MNAIQLMMKEHEYIKRMLKVVRVYCYKVLNNEQIDYDDFYKIIDFIRNYSDKHHHAKEEDILFQVMSEQLGERVKNGPIMGMLVEHDMGRLYIQNLELALEEFKKGNDEARLDIIANAVSYANLLTRHIDKEDTAIYTFAESALSEENMLKVNKESDLIENEATAQGIQKEYIGLLESFEEKIK